MRLRRRGRDDEAEAALARAREFAWRVHAAQESWTAKVDTKASIVFALEGAILVALVATSGGDGLISELQGWRLRLMLLGGIATLVATVLAGLVIYPLLGSSTDHARDHRENLIYFGHLRHWQSTDSLADRLMHITGREEVEHLARQLVRLGTRNWVKHRRLQAAVVSALVGAALIVVAALWP